MRKYEFKRIAFDDWEQAATGSIEGNENYLEIVTTNLPILHFLCKCRISGGAVPAPVVWADGDYKVFTGEYKVIHMDGEGIVLRKSKS